MQERPIILWFRQDLRLSDHQPLMAACKTNHPIIPLYIYETHTQETPPMGSASKWWLHHSLTSLDKDLQARGAKLIKRSGPARDVLREFCQETSAAGLYFHSSVLPGAPELENELKRWAHQEGLDCQAFSGELLFDPTTIMTMSYTPYKVFTPFWAACQKAPPPAEPLPQPPLLPSPKNIPNSENLEEWHLTPTTPNWAKGFSQEWYPGEAGAQRALEKFLQTKVATYQKERDVPANKGTSCLSPHLHFGEVSIRSCWQQVKAKGGGDAFLRELGWREFCHHLLYHWPNIIEAPFKQEFTQFPWGENQTAITAWQRGQTGYPIIDAGMQQLWQTGWMHNRVRMITGSFLVKNLKQHWHVGRDWFWDTLVDADLANNCGGWQWVAGSGADAAPYFRIFNPVTQSKKFDPDGTYIRHFLPALSALSAPHIHDPTNAPAAALQQAGITLGQTYPRAIVDLSQSREEALAAYEHMRQQKE